MVGCGLGITLLFLLASWPLFAGNTAVLQIDVSLTRGEHSRDSHSSTETIKVYGDSIVYDKTERGAHASRGPVHREFKLTSDDRRRLAETLESGGLLVTRSLSRPMTVSGPRGYFELSLVLRADKRKGALDISGPVGAVELKLEKLYKSAGVLLEEIYKILNRHDQDIVYRELVN